MPWCARFLKLYTSSKRINIPPIHPLHDGIKMNCKQWIFKGLNNKQWQTILAIMQDEGPMFVCKCYDPSLGFATKARGRKVAGQEGSPGVMPHALGSARKCEGIDPHTLKGIPTLGVWSPNGLPNLQSTIAKVKTQWFEDFFISLKSYSNIDVQNGLV